MSNADNSLSGFGKLVPGFDFLQNLARQAAGSAAQSIPQLPRLGNWVAPTLNVEELDKHIQELKAVQFWLDQNVMALKATIQALEVQKMTLATLKGMNFNMGDMAHAFRLKVADSVAGGVQHGADKATTFSGLEIPPSAYQAAQAGAAPTAEPAAQAAPAKARTSKAETKPTASQPAAAAPGVVDAMQWWGALTQQFQTIAADAMKEAARKSTIDTPGNLATGLAKGAMKTATDMAQSAGKTVAGNAQAAMNTALRSSQAWPVPVAAKTAARPAAKPQPKASARKSPRKTAR